MSGGGSLDDRASRDGLVVVDKPAGWTSHDVVGRMRRLAGTRKVGHAGTLDPMATGVLVIGIGKATRLLGRITLTEKEYAATIRLGITTITDDAEGEEIAYSMVGDLANEISLIESQLSSMTGKIQQVPSSVSAIKVDGKRSYARVRAGEDVALPARPVTVSRFSLGSIAAEKTADGRDVVDIEADVTCSSGTYVRALARDAGAALGVGGHLTALRRTRVGPFTIGQAHTLEQLAEEFTFIPLADVARAMFTVLELTDEQAKAVSHGNRLPWPEGFDEAEPIALFDSAGTPLALAECKSGVLAPTVVWVPA